MLKSEGGLGGSHHDPIRVNELDFLCSVRRCSRSSETLASDAWRSDACSSWRDGGGDGGGDELLLPVNGWRM